MQINAESRTHRATMQPGRILQEKRYPTVDREQFDFALAVSAGMRNTPRSIPSRFLYDARGSMLFEQITRQPEYYLTRTEASLLAASAMAIRDTTGPVALVELGSGNSEKTDCLLCAWSSHGDRVAYIPVDVCESALAKARRIICQRHPDVQVVSMNMDYQQAFDTLDELSPALVLFLGSSIGNFDDGDISGFLHDLHAAMSPGDFFLGGFDLVKSPETIQAAYNDAAGVTACFTRNLFVRMNRELGSEIHVNHVEHCARYSEERERVEIEAVFTTAQEFIISPLGERHAIRQGEAIRTEICRKFRLETLLPFLESIGFRTRRVFTDHADWFALILLQKETIHQSGV